MATRLTSMSAPVMRVSHGQGLPALVALAEPWRRLANATEAGPLVGPDWTAALVKSYGLEAKFHLWAVELEGQVLAVVPLLLGRPWWRGLPVRAVGGTVGGPTLRFDLVAAAGAAGEAAVAALWRGLEKWGAWGLVDLHPVPRGGGAEQLLACAASANYPVTSAVVLQSPYVDLSRGAATAISATSANFRHKLRRTRRRLLERGTVSFDTVERPDDRDLEVFFALEAAGRKGRGSGKAILRRSEQEQRFYREMVRSIAAQGQFAYHRLRLGDRVIAASLGVLGSQTYHAVRWCYDEMFAAFGPGHLLIESLLQECERRNLHRFDFTGPDYDYKRDWTKFSLPHSNLTIFRRNWRGRALRRWKLVPFPRHRP